MLPADGAEGSRRHVAAQPGLRLAARGVDDRPVRAGAEASFRFIAGTLGVSLTPVREAIRRLVAEGAFEMQPNRSVRVPLMTRDRILELRDIRLAVEGLAAEKAAAVATREQAAELRRIANELLAARSRGDTAADRAKIREFHFALYAIAGQPTLLRVIEGLWLQTGPYMNLLYPDFIASPRGPETPARIIKALQAHDAARHGANREAISATPCPMSPTSPTRPARSPRRRRSPAKRRRARPSPSPAGTLTFA